MRLQSLIDSDKVFLKSLFEEQGSDTMLQAYDQALVEARRHGHFEQWEAALEGLPTIESAETHFNDPHVSVNTATVPVNDRTEAQLLSSCQAFIPWRKGPFTLFGMEIDTEWRSDIKWQRLEKCVDLQNKRVLDVGCGNGYYAWRMLGAGARQVLGIDPYVLYWFQYLLLAYYIGKRSVAVLPMTLEAFPDKLSRFDVVFSMGVLYHRRSPIEHLERLKSVLESGGQLVLETLVIEGDAHTCLCPERKYANMSNVWFIPSCRMLEGWLRRCKFVQIEKIDDAITTPDEQRSTAWMPFHSLQEALVKERTQTIEGHPVPRRVVYTARKA